MKPAPFSYLRPTTLEEALAALAEHADAKVLAGGQSLLPLLSMRLAAPAVLVDVNRVPGLDGVRSDEDGVAFGALVRHAALERDADARRVQPLLGQALRLVAHPTIRNQGTTVGSLAHADAAAEMPMVLTLLGGHVTAASVRGERRIEARDLYVGPLESCLEHDEMLTGAWVPALPARTGSAIDEVSRRHGDYALVGVAALVSVGETGAVESVRAGYLSVSDTPLAVDLSEAFADGELSPANLAAAVEVAHAAIEPDADIHATADYRRHLAGVLTRRVVAAAHEAVTTKEGVA
ncbi:FAD binding domain-containing protein [Solicola sp. PLA-1-18]|uniref:FAD binding domain-containing protein n=1 Tax=Solicola sp. PLA-1-18 TaxID=3380532 RepID=UPI003B764889